MTDADLIRRLRNWPSCYSHDSWVRTICTEAAAALEERARLHKEVADEAYNLAHRALAAEAERDRLRAALARIANFDDWELRDFATGVARAALTPAGPVGEKP